MISRSNFNGLNLGGMMKSRAAAPRQVTPALMATSTPQIENPPLPPYTPPAAKKKQTAKDIGKQISFGMKNTPMGSGGMGALMGFMGLPFLSKGAGAGKGSGGQWMTVDPRNLTMFPASMGNAGGGGATGGGGGTTTEPPPEDPNAPPPLPGDKYKLNMIPEWWKDWYRTQGQYGGVPPVDGLL